MAICDESTLYKGTVKRGFNRERTEFSSQTSDRYKTDISKQIFQFLSVVLTSELAIFFIFTDNWYWNSERFLGRECVVNWLIAERVTSGWSSVQSCFAWTRLRSTLLRREFLQALSRDNRMESTWSEQRIYRNASSRGLILSSSLCRIFLFASNPSNRCNKHFLRRSCFVLHIFQICLRVTAFLSVCAVRAAEKNRSQPFPFPWYIVSLGSSWWNRSKFTPAKFKFPLASQRRRRYSKGFEEGWI